MSVPRCDTPINNRGPCNTPMREVLSSYGRLTWVCPRCVARSQGRCWSCGAPRTNHPERGIYCEPCRVKAARTSERRSRIKDGTREYFTTYARERYQRDPEYRARRLAHVKAWKAKNPDKVKAHWERFKAKRDAARAADVRGAA